MALSSKSPGTPGTTGNDDLFASRPVNFYERCYHKHPALPIAGEKTSMKDGQHTVESVTYNLYGGSCLQPAVTDADIYLGFDSGMAAPRIQPWNKSVGPLKLLYPIRDGGVPDTSVEEFNRLLDWLAVQLIAGKKVHIGCIGGHGRTGLVMAALVTRMTGEKDSISYVRKNYCEKTVESKQQVDWLHLHYGITKQIPSRDMHRPIAAPAPAAYRPSNAPNLDDVLGKTTSSPGWASSGASSSPKGKTFQPSALSKGMTAAPVLSKMSIWGDPRDAMVRFDK